MSRGRCWRSIVGTLTTASVACALLISASARAAAQQPLPWEGTSWYWGSPRPQGQDLTWVDFAGRRGFAGPRPTLLSQDAGASWTMAAAARRWSDLRFVDGGRTLVGEAGCGAAYRSDDAGSSFRRLPLGSPAGTECVKVDFPTAEVGYALVGASILRTEDGGANFTPRTPVADAVTLRFVDPDVGFALTRDTIYRTEDAARSWTPVATVSSGVSDVRFADSATGFAVGRGSLLLRTLDGGRSWSRAPLSGAPRLNLVSLKCVDRNRCLIVTVPFDGPEEARTPLLLTTDGGATARPLPGSAGAAAIDFISASRVVAVGARGLTLVSDDGGESFGPVGGGSDQEYYRLRAVTPRLLYAFGPRAVGRSVDAGRTWRALPLPKPLPKRNFLADASFTGTREGLALSVREDGAQSSSTTLFRTDDGGQSWRNVNTSRLHELSGVLALDGRRVVAAGRRGLRVSRDGGQRFRSVGSPRLRSARLSKFDRAGKLVVAYGPHTFALSSDLRRWRLRRLPRGIDAQDVDFVSARVGYMVDGDGRLRRTRDAGRRWSLMQATGPYLGVSEREQHIAFADARHGFVAATVDGGNPETGRGGDYYDRVVMLRTDDAGRTFRPQFQSGGNVFGDVAAPGRGTSVMAIFPSLMWSPTGGDAAVRTRLSARVRPLRLRRAGTVTVRGRLAPARARDAVVISRRWGARLSVRLVDVGADGRFSSRWPVRRNSVFVVQWRGRGDRRGAGTAAMRVAIRGPRR